jgi:hypothetical protein
MASLFWLRLFSVFALGLVDELDITHRLTWNVDLGTFGDLGIFQNLTERLSDRDSLRIHGGGFGDSIRILGGGFRDSVRIHGGGFRDSVRIHGSGFRNSVRIQNSSGQNNGGFRDSRFRDSRRIENRGRQNNRGFRDSVGIGSGFRDWGSFLTDGLGDWHSHNIHRGFGHFFG